MPKTTSFDIEKFIKIANKYSLRHENSNSLKGPSDPCWLRISEELGFTISAKYAYTIVKSNRYERLKVCFLSSLKSVTMKLW